MLRSMLKSKIHRARVTGCCLDYEGSITIDPVLLRAADILPYEEVHVLNIQTGARFTTYSISGLEGQSEICLNGAAARLAQKGDTVIILAYAQLNESEVKSHMPHLVYVDELNRISHTRRAIGAIKLEENFNESLHSDCSGHGR